MSTKKLIQLILIVTSFLFLFLYLLKEEIIGAYCYTCPTGYSCTVGSASLWYPAGSWVDVGSPYEDCIYHPTAGGYACFFNTQCCGEATYYMSYADCKAGTNGHDLYCCSKASCVDCTPGSAPSCPTGTVTTNTGDLHSTTSSSCDRGTGCDPRYNTNTRSCYCETCTLPSCTPTYADTNQGYGSIVLYCRNGVASTPDRITKCDSRQVTCYCTSCSLPNCPAPLSNTATVASPNMILSSFRSCTNNCSVATTGDCFEVPTAQPTESIVINYDALNVYNFNSTNHSGIPGTVAGDLNDPISMIATYTDTNGAADVEAVSVWFRNVANTGEPQTPLWISTTATPQAPSTDSWGFLMHREGTNWVPYTPSWNVSPQVWTRAIYTVTPSGVITFMISGPSRGNMVEVTITSPISSVGNIVTMPFRFRFSGTNITENVSEISYRILLMGLDKFSFTPSDNYSFSVSNYWSGNQLRYRTTPTVAQTYARDWFDTTRRWAIDKQVPSVQFMNGTPVVSGNTLRIDWQASDSKNLYAVVGNVYSNAGADARQVTLSTSTAGVSLKEPFIPGAENPLSFERGNLNSPNWAFRVNPNLTTTSNSGSVTVDIGANRVGSLRFYLTAFDDAGNMASAMTFFNLDDWFVTDGGLAYSSGGTTFQTKSTTTSWIGILPPTAAVGESLLYNVADYSSEMWADSNPAQPPSALLRSSVSGSYNIRNFKSHNLTSYYDVLWEMYTQKKNDIPISDLKELNIVGNVTVANANLTAIFTPMSTYNVAIITGKLVIDRLNCNGNALIFVDGDIDILPNITNQTANKNACIFVSTGDINIYEGRNNSLGGTFRYDQINGYFFADGNIIINHETSKASTAIVDGVYINGGIQSLGIPKGIVVERYLRLSERLVYPVLAIDSHPKYGVLSGVFFANNFTFQKIEVGFKP